MTDPPPALPNLRRRPGVLICLAIASLVMWYAFGMIMFTVWEYAP